MEVAFSELALCRDSLVLIHRLMHRLQQCFAPGELSQVYLAWVYPHDEEQLCSAMYVVTESTASGFSGNLCLQRNVLEGQILVVVVAAQWCLWLPKGSIAQGLLCQCFQVLNCCRI